MSGKWNFMSGKWIYPCEVVVKVLVLGARPLKKVEAFNVLLSDDVQLVVSNILHVHPNPGEMIPI